MKVAWRVLASLVFLQGSAFAQIQPQPQTQVPAPEIQVVDGKISMSALGMPLSRVVSMLDRAMGLKSKVAPEAASRPISVRFKDLALKDAVQKIFEGQPLNYSLIEGKGIDVSGVAGTTTTSTNSPFPEAAPITQTPLPGASPIQPAVPINAAGQPAGQPGQGAPLGVTANPTNPNNQVPATNTAPPGAVAPGQMPPPIGGVNPLTQPVGAPAVGTAAPAVGFPMATPAPPQPTGPGTVGGAAPGTISTPGTIPR